MARAAWPERWIRLAMPRRKLAAPASEQKPKPRASANANGSGSLTGSLEKPATTEPTQPRSFTSPVKASANADGNANADASVSAHQPQ